MLCSSCLTRTIWSALIFSVHSRFQWISSVLVQIVVGAGTVGYTNFERTMLGLCLFGFCWWSYLRPISPHMPQPTCRQKDSRQKAPWTPRPRLVFNGYSSSQEHVYCGCHRSAFPCCFKWEQQCNIDMSSRQFITFKNIHLAPKNLIYFFTFVLGWRSWAQAF